LGLPFPHFLDFRSLLEAILKVADKFSSI